MDIGKAVPEWLRQWIKEAALCWEEAVDDIGYRIRYEYAGSVPQNPDDGYEDMWHVILHPTSDYEAVVDVQACLEMLDDVESIKLSTCGTVVIWGSCNEHRATMRIILCCYTPDDAEYEKLFGR